MWGGCEQPFKTTVVGFRKWESWEQLGAAGTRLGCDGLDGRGARGALQLRLAALRFIVLRHH